MKRLESYVRLWNIPDLPADDTVSDSRFLTYMSGGVIIGLIILALGECAAYYSEPHFGWWLVVQLALCLLVLAMFFRPFKLDQKITVFSNGIMPLAATIGYLIGLFEALAGALSPLYGLGLAAVMVSLRLVWWRIRMSEQSVGRKIQWDYYTVGLECALAIAALIVIGLLAHIHPLVLLTVAIGLLTGGCILVAMEHGMESLSRSRENALAVAASVYWDIAYVTTVRPVRALSRRIRRTRTQH